MLPIPKFVRLFYLVYAVVGDNSAPVSGVYNARSVADLWVCQMVLNVETQIAKFEFILNNNAGRNLTYPKYFQVDNIEYTYNELNSTILFLTNPEDPDREIVREMIEYFAPIGDLKIPIEAAWTEDGSIVASIILLDVELVQNDELDMQSILTEFQQMKDEGFETNLFIEPVAALSTSETPDSSSSTLSSTTEDPSSTASQFRTVQPIVAAVNSSKDGTGKFDSPVWMFLATILFASFPLAEGFLDWLVYL